MLLNNERRLSTIQKIVNIQPIENADKIELATVLGWQVVVKKDEFKIGDLCIYIEIDSIVPDIEYFEFMRERNRSNNLPAMRNNSNTNCTPLVKKQRSHYDYIRQ